MFINKADTTIIKSETKQLFKKVLFDIENDLLQFKTVWEGVQNYKEDDQTIKDLKDVENDVIEILHDKVISSVIYGNDYKLTYNQLIDLYYSLKQIVIKRGLLFPRYDTWLTASDICEMMYIIISLIDNK